jgi:nucleoside-diphosphate-sugar epimerase
VSRVGVTGATGAVGAAVVEALIARGHSVVTVGRAADVRWDLREALPPQAAEALTTADVIVHAAANINLADSYEDLHRVNVGAVDEMVQTVAATPLPPRLVHISSAYAEQSGDDVPSNGYERTKAEAETVVLESPLQACILRPSLVMGRSADGAIHRYSGVYIFIRMLRLGLIPAIPGFSEVGVDIVPVDAVVQQAVEQVEDPASRGIVAITSGAAAPSIEKLVTTACDVFDRSGEGRVDRPKFVTPEVYHRLFRPLIIDKLSPAQKLMLETVEIFLPYFERDHVFASDLAFTTGQLLEIWKKSIMRWLDETYTHTPSGRVVWARRW